jgi:hypothetical protein
VIDDDWALTELMEIEPAEDEDIEALLAVAVFCVIVVQRKRVAPQLSRVLLSIHGKSKR